MIKMEKNNALKYRFLLSSIAFCISFFLCFLFVDNTIGYCGDDVQIIHQAIVALNGNVQEFINDYSYMNANNVAQIATNAYSWGTSFLLIPIYKIFGLENIMMLKMVMIMSFSTFIFVFSMYLSRKTNLLISAIITVFLSTCPYFINFSNEIMKDIPFLLISFIFILAVDNFLKKNNLANKSFIHYLFL